MIQTPCKGICKISEGKCIGCKRTRYEIKKWLTATEEEKESILESITFRLALEKNETIS